MHWLHRFASEPADRVFTAATWLGEPRVLLPVFVLVALAMAGLGLYRDGLITAALGVFAGTLAVALKHVVFRARPPFWRTIEPSDPYSFPSGHAVLSLVFYGWLAYLCAGESIPGRGGAFAAAALLIAAIGISRVYLGLHWPSDVLASWAIGAAILAVGVLARRREKDAR